VKRNANLTGSALSCIRVQIFRNINLLFGTLTRRKRLFDAIKFRTSETRRVIAEVFRNVQLNWIGKTTVGPVGSARHRAPITNSPPITSSNKVTPDERNGSRPKVFTKDPENNVDPCSISKAQIKPRIKNLSNVALFNQLFHVLPLERKSFVLSGAWCNECPKDHSESNRIKPSKVFEHGSLLPVQNEECRQDDNLRIFIEENDVIDDDIAENDAVEDNTVENYACCAAYDMDFSLTSHVGIDDRVCRNEGICDNLLSSNRNVMHSTLPIQELFPVRRHNQSTFILCASKAIQNNYILSPPKLSIRSIFPIPEERKTFAMESHLILNRGKFFTDMAPKVHKVETTLRSRINIIESSLLLIIYLFNFS
jgi:hypothetical protein